MSIKRLVKHSIQASRAYKPPTGRRDAIKLDLNENYAILSDSIIEKLRGFDRFILSSYPEYGELAPQVAAYVGVSADQVIFTNGSDHAIQLLTDLFFKKGDTVVVPSPVFFPYYHFLDINEVAIKEVLYTDEGTWFAFPGAETLRALDASVSGVILCNPNNPLGASIPDADLRAIVERTAELDIPLIIDEAYFEFGASDAAKYLAEGYEHVIILRTFSKAFGLAGARLGYVIAHPDIIAEIDKLRLAWSVNHFAVFAGQVVLDELPYFKEKIREQIRLKDELRALLESKGITCYDSDTNFLIAKHPDHTAIVARLKAANILAQDVSHYPHSGLLLKDAFRISIPAHYDLPALQAVL